MHLHGRFRHRLFFLISFVCLVLVAGSLVLIPQFSQLPPARRVNEIVDQPVAISPSPTPIKSKLGIFILSGLTPGTKKILASHPAVIKVMDPQSIAGMTAAIRQYKQDYPDGITLIRFFDNSLKFTIDDDAIKAAETYFATIIRPRLDALGTNASDYDLIESPNEQDQTPGWETVESARWLGQFWGELSRLNYLKGFKTCLGSISVGNPGGSPEEIRSKLSAFLPAVQTANRNGGALCYHAYTLEYSTKPETEQWYSLRYRTIHDDLVALDSTLKNFPVILSEGGVDLSGTPATAGWIARGTAEKYQDWLTWYDSELLKDSYVQGVTLFQIGDPYWSSFNLEPIADWLVTRSQ